MNLTKVHWKIQTKELLDSYQQVHWKDAFSTSFRANDKIQPKT
jgi:hypothetical protein